MSTFPGSPRVLKGGIVLVDPATAAVLKIIPLQYNPDSLSRTLAVQSMGGESRNRSEALRLTAPPIETFKVEAELDATDQLEIADSLTVQLGLQPLLAALETIIYPKSSDLLNANSLAAAGTLEIAPNEAPLTLFIWNKNRILPVRFTEFSITEEAFDVNLNPIRAKISLGMRVLNVDDLGFDHKGGNLYMSYQQNKERIAGLFSGGSLTQFGLNSIT